KLPGFVGRLGGVVAVVEDDIGDLASVDTSLLGVDVLEISRRALGDGVIEGRGAALRIRRPDLDLVLGDTGICDRGPGRLLTSTRAERDQKRCQRSDTRPSLCHRVSSPVEADKSVQNDSVTIEQ